MRLQYQAKTASGGLSIANSAATLWVFTLTMFLSATLMFFVEPMFAKMVLPLLGGSPAVWNTAVVTYQALLLGGYIYAHLTTRWLGIRRQAALHAVLVLVPLFVLPIRVPGGWSPPTAGNPILWLVGLLIVAVGLPFFAVSACSPLLQTWFARTGHRSAGDPYFLYAASNVGSILGLLAYPAILEPRLRLAQQSNVWMLGYGLLAALTIVCAAITWRSARPEAAATPEDELTVADAHPVSNGRRLRWVLLALVPSSLMLSVTTYLTTSIAPIPLLWVIPLGVYLLSFILVFSTRTLIPRAFLVRAFPFLLLILIIALLTKLNQPILFMGGLHVVTFFVAAMLCHGALAADRPGTRHLTEFYLWMSVGGVAGGLFTVLIAPVVFSTLAEYPLMLVLLCLLQGDPVARSLRHALAVRDLIGPLLVGAMTAGLLLAVRVAGLASNQLGAVLAFALPPVVIFGFSRRPIRFGLGIGAMLFAASLFGADQAGLLHRERTFFGLIRVGDVSGAAGQQYHVLIHSGVNHGLQNLDPAHHDDPLTYYTRSGPIGQVFAAFDSVAANWRVGAVGLGAGSLACYSHPGQAWTFYEIDPAVVRIAQDQRYFTFLSDCAPAAGIVLGDARLSLQQEQDEGDSRYNLLVLDAYSSDTVPVHLITREALTLYLNRLTSDGLLAFHISNRYLDLKPVLGNLAHDAGLTAAVEEDLELPDALRSAGKTQSIWVVMARTPAALARLTADPRWQPLKAHPDQAVWTDDYSSILSVWRPR